MILPHIYTPSTTSVGADDTWRETSSAVPQTLHSGGPPKMRYPYRRRYPYIRRLVLNRLARLGHRTHNLEWIRWAPSIRRSFYIYFFFYAHFHFPAYGQAVVTGVIPSPPRFLPSISIAHRVQQSHCSSIVHRVLLTHALALSASQFVHKKNSQRI